MKVDHKVDYFYKYPSELFDIQYSFSNDMSSDTLSSCNASIFDVDGIEQSSTMISNKTVSSPNVTFSIQNGTGGETYQIKLVGTTSNLKVYTHFIKCEVLSDITLNTNLGDSSANSYVTLEEANNYIRNKRGHSSTWDELSIEGKKRLLSESVKDIDMFNFIGEQYYENQALQFPRDDHDVFTGNCATPLTINSFKNTSFTVTTYGEPKSNTNYWKYGTVHITNATPLYDVRRIDTSNVTTSVVTMKTNFSATPTTNTQFIAFEPLHQEIKDAQCEQVLHILANSPSYKLSLYRSIANSVTIGDTSVNFKKEGKSEVPISSKARRLLSRWIERNITVLRG